MSVTQYTIGCGYELLKLKDTVFFLSKNQLKTINIDNGEAYATFVNQSPYPPSPNRLKGFNVKLTETESLDERYRFTKQLTMSIHGHLTDSRFLMDDDFYIVVQTEDGTYYLVNVDFPSKMTYTYNLSQGQNQTDFTFTSNSNHPTLKLNWNPVTWNTCQTYQVYGIDGLKLLEKDYTTIDAEQGVINLFDGHEFKDVDFLKNTISLQEAYDGELTTTTISFEIPFNNYKPSWQYNLLEFDQNLYVAHITPKNSNSDIFAGYEHGLQPSYEINGSASNGESTSIKITLVEASEWGIFEFDTWSYYRDSTKAWVGIDSEVKCIDLGVGIHTLMQEYDVNGTPTQRYKCLDGFESQYTNYNIVGTYTEDEVESFRTSRCTVFRARGAAPTGIYTCINGDKYELIGDQTSYDGGRTWIVESYEIGQMVESASSFCEIEPQYKWEISDEWDCISQFTRWIPSGYTCINGDKYQNNLKQVSDDYIHWVNSNPLEWSASTVIEYDSDDCKSYRWVETDDIMCVETPVEFRTISGEPYCEGCDLYVNVEDQITYDSGTTWQTIELHKYLYEKYAFECGGDCDINFDEEYLSFVALEDGTFTVPTDVYYSLDDGATWTYLANAHSTPTIKMGEIVRWKAEKNYTGSGSYTYFGAFSSTCKFDIFGNIMSLIYGDNFIGQTDFASRRCSLRLLFKNSLVSSINNLRLPATELLDSYESMFEGCTNLRTARLDLPAISSATGYDYYSMFKGCTSLTVPPRFFGTELVTAYRSMFEGCTSLTTAPELPATTLYSYAYESMFKGCTSLTTAPELPATTLADYCYASMFKGCTSLNNVTCLATDISAQGCTNGWFNGVDGTVASGTFTKAANMNDWTTGTSGIPSGWTVNDYTN